MKNSIRKPQKNFCGSGFTARVVKVKRGEYVVEAQEDMSAACGGCRACAQFFTSSRRFTAASTERHAVGDEVTVKPPKEKPLLAILLLLIVPLVGLGAGVAVAAAAHLPEQIALLLALGGLAVGFTAVLILDRLVCRKRYQYTIIDEKKGEERT